MMSQNFGCNIGMAVGLWTSESTLVGGILEGKEMIRVLI